MKDIYRKFWKNIIITSAYRSLKGNNKLRKNFCEDFLNEQKMAKKAPLGDFNLNDLEYDIYSWSVLKILF